MTWLTYETSRGRIAVQVPPGSAHQGERQGGDWKGFPSPPAAVLTAIAQAIYGPYLHLMRVLDNTDLARDGVWYCQELRH